MNRAGIPDPGFDDGSETGVLDACGSLAGARVPAASGELDPEHAAAARQMIAAVVSLAANFRPVVRKAPGYSGVSRTIPRPPERLPGSRGPRE
jgi:hypothetical protein